MVFTVTSTRLNSCVIISTGIANCFFPDVIQLFGGSIKFAEKFPHEKLPALFSHHPPTFTSQRHQRGEGVAVMDAKVRSGYRKSGYIEGVYKVQRKQNSVV